MTSKAKEPAQKRKLHTPVKTRPVIKALDSPEPMASRRLRQTPARLKYLGEGDLENESSKKELASFTPLRASSINQLRGTSDLNTPAMEAKDVRMTRQRAKQMETAIQRK